MASFYLLLSLLIMFPLLLIFLMSKSKLKFHSAKQNYRLPPGPWTLPFIGSIHHLIARGLPHRALRYLSQQYGGLMFVQLGEHPTVVVSSREAAKEIMTTHDLRFCSRPVNNASKLGDYLGKDIVFAPYGEVWREMRKVAIVGLLSSKRVQSFRSIREQEVNSFIKQIFSSSSCTEVFNLSDTFLSLANDISLRVVTGSSSKEKDVLLTDIRQAVEYFAMFKIANLFPSLRFMSVLTGLEHSAKQCYDSATRFVGAIIDERRKEGLENAHDAFSVYLRKHDEDPENYLSMDCIIGAILDLIIGGSENPSSILTWAMTELVKNPKVMKQAQTKIRQQLQGREDITEVDLADLNIVQFIIKETIRLHAPTPLLLPRKCLETCNILGYDIPKGTTVIINAWDIGRNPNYWKDAEEFKPERFLEVECNAESEGMDFKYIPFGGGRRGCPGVSFGLAVVELVLAKLLYHFDWELPNGMSPDDVDMTETFGITARKKSPLMLRAIPYYQR